VGQSWKETPAFVRQRRVAGFAELLVLIPRVILSVKTLRIPESMSRILYNRRSRRILSGCFELGACCALLSCPLSGQQLLPTPLFAPILIAVGRKYCLKCSSIRSGLNTPFRLGSHPHLGSPFPTKSGRCGLSRMFGVELRLLVFIRTQTHSDCSAITPSCGRIVTWLRITLYRS